MGPEADKRNHVRRVVLPSGKTIEVVYFDQRVDDDAAHDDLHVCGGCGSKLVHPIEWDQAGETHWEVTLRCPNCEWCGTGVFEQGVVERFDEELERGTEVLVRDLKRLVHANLEDEVERFVTALEADHIVPEDF